MSFKVQSLEQIKRICGRAMHDPRFTEAARRQYAHLYGLACDASTDLDIIVEQALNMGLRGGSFPDDYVGWLDD